MEPLATTAAVIDALGGTAAVARLTGRSMQAVSNWKDRGLFTAAAYEPISRALAEIGRRADPSVWKSLPPSALIQFSASAA
jgi:hypothetical protein